MSIYNTSTKSMFNCLPKIKTKQKPSQSSTFIIPARLALKTDNSTKQRTVIAK